MNLSLLKHLLLALVPGVVIAVPITLAYVSDSDPAPFTEQTAAVLYCALFGGFVMAPFIASRSGFIPRAGVLIVMAPVVYVLVSMLVTFIESATNDWSIGEFPILLIIVATVFVLNLLNAVLLAIVAPLRTNRKFWEAVGLTGALTGVLCAVLFHYYYCLFWCDWTTLLLCIPLFAWPLLFCASLYQWRKHHPVHYNGVRH